jgi:acetyltransferase-like isoleucine patch superfamily enzyme
VITITAARILRFGIRLLSYPELIVDSLKNWERREHCVAHKTARLLPGSLIVNKSRCREQIQIGAHTISRGECIVSSPTGSIKIGSHCYIGDHTRIWSAVGVTIGNQVMISHSANIHDNDAHPQSVMARRRHVVAGLNPDMTDVAMAPIVIEDDVWVGFNAAIMKGVTIGRGAIIGAAAMITKDVPPYAIMVGNPARQVGTVSD